MQRIAFLFITPFNRSKLTVLCSHSLRYWSKHKMESASVSCWFSDPSAPLNLSSYVEGSAMWSYCLPPLTMLLQVLTLYQGTVRCSIFACIFEFQMLHLFSHNIFLSHHSKVVTVRRRLERTMSATDHSSRRSL